jgi:hypothetical protein
MKQLIILFLFFFQLSCNETKKDNLIIAGNYFDCLFKKGDFESLKKLIDTGAVYNQAAGLPYGGKYNGFGEWATMFTKVDKYFNLQLINEPIYFSNPGEKKVIANFTIKFTCKKNKKELLMQISELLEFKDGKIITVTPFYFDTKTLTELINN